MKLSSFEDGYAVWQWITSSDFNGRYIQRDGIYDPRFVDMMRTTMRKLAGRVLTDWQGGWPGGYIEIDNNDAEEVRIRLLVSGY